MQSTDIGGDRSETWRSSYGRVRKDPLRSSSSTNRRRMDMLWAGSPPVAGTWLDLGAGDGNLAAALIEQGASHVVAMEPQMELMELAGPLGGSGSPCSRVAGSALDLPLAAGSVDVVVVMDVLHHIPAASLDRVLREVARVMRPAGVVLVCEPCSSVVRRVLTTLLMSPLAAITAFTRAKRTMVEAEWETLSPWLGEERRFPDVAARSGYVVEGLHRGPLHAYWRLRPAR